MVFESKCIGSFSALFLDWNKNLKGHNMSMLWYPLLFVAMLSLCLVIYNVFMKY